MGDFVELGCEATNHLTEKYFDRGYDFVTGRRRSDTLDKLRGKRGRRKNTLPPPESDNRDITVDRDTQNYTTNTQRDIVTRDDSLERQSETHERVLRRYESERDDPRRKPESVLPATDLRKIPRDSRMSNANEYQSYEQSSDGRPRSQPAGSRYYYDDEEYGSDYDDRTGRRTGASGRGYDSYYDDQGYDREYVETERYRGPARTSRQDSYASRGYDDQSGVNAGAVTQYRRSNNDVSQYDTRRSQSRGRRDRDRRYSEVERDYSRSRSRSRSAGIRGKLENSFDTSLQGIGVGIAGAVVGGLAGREFGGRGEHRNRDILLGAVIGGLGANAAEHKWRDWKEEKKEKLERDEQKWENRVDGRSRSAMR